MKKFIKKIEGFTIAAIIVIGVTVFVSCQSNETKKVETETTTMPAETSVQPTDTLPALDTDTLSSTKPETIKNQ